MNSNGRQLKQVFHTHGTSCLSFWPRGFSELNRSLHYWIFTSVSIQSSLLLFHLWHRTLHVGERRGTVQSKSFVNKWKCKFLAEFDLTLCCFYIPFLDHYSLFLGPFFIFANPGSYKHGIRQWIQKRRIKVLHREAAFLQKLATQRFFFLMVFHGCYFDCGDDWVIFQSRVLLVDQEQQRWTHTSTEGRFLSHQNLNT